MRLDKASRCDPIPYTLTVAIQGEDEIEDVIGLGRHLPKDDSGATPCSPAHTRLAVIVSSAWDRSHVVLRHVMGIQLLLAVQPVEGGRHRQSVDLRCSHDDVN